MKIDKLLKLDKKERVIVAFTFGCYVFTHALQIVSDTLFEDYDNSSQLLVSQSTIDDNYVLWNLLKHTSRWDAIFFIEISEFGYVVEKNHAFFPLYAYILKVLAAPLIWILGMNHVIAVLLVNLAVGLLVYCTSAILIYRLGHILMGCSTRSMIAALLFAVNPAACHFLAVYTENLYTLILLVCCYVFYTNYGEQPNFVTKERVSYAVFIYSSCMAALGGFVRSNSILLLSVIGYPLLQRCIVFAGLAMKSQSAEQRMENARIAVHCVMVAVLCILITFLAQILVMYGPYETYCVEQSDTKWYPPWCNNLVPNVYPYLQSTFWNVGFLTFFERVWYQILIGMIPVVFIAWQIVYYLRRNWLHFVTLGLSGKNKREAIGFLNQRLTPLVIYSIIFWIITFFFAAIDSANRFFSHTPTYYWFMAEVVYGERKPKNEKVMIILFIMYGLGIFQFSNFFVWV